MSECQKFDTGKIMEVFCTIMVKGILSKQNNWTQNAIVKMR